MLTQLAADMLPSLYEQMHTSTQGHTHTLLHTHIWEYQIIWMAGAGVSRLTVNTSHGGGLCTRSCLLQPNILNKPFMWCSSCRCVIWYAVDKRRSEWVLFAEGICHRLMRKSFVFPSQMEKQASFSPQLCHLDFQTNSESLLSWSSPRMHCRQTHSVYGNDILHATCQSSANPVVFYLQTVTATSETSFVSVTRSVETKHWDKKQAEEWVWSKKLFHTN